ncbi:hypothetical protein IV203_030161 [Nitzschia inconspicua]|uniref:Uncharacterized protein n=1 Tax=Nitzschia inconspicua TaxID=303405 RepID=A0A9K3LS27_9STRA|nr:hypothetical protein IV203_004884 [Nitzschia inconspicua]KAG7367490.1 hypothetical protein IV203_030161 [Nitzschia inconspicua]
MNPTYADDFRGPPALNSRVDADSGSGFVRIAPTSSANRRSLPDNCAILTDIPTSEPSAPTDSPAPAPTILPDNCAILTDIPTSEPSAPTDSPAPAPTMCSHGSTLRVSTASTYGDDVHASIGCDVPFALSAIPPTGDGDLRAALEAVSLFASNILACYSLVPEGASPCCSSLAVHCWTCATEGACSYCCSSMAISFKLHPSKILAPHSASVPEGAFFASSSTAVLGSCLCSLAGTFFWFYSTLSARMFTSTFSFSIAPPRTAMFLAI